MDIRKVRSMRDSFLSQLRIEGFENIVGGVESLGDDFYRITVEFENPEYGQVVAPTLKLDKSGQPSWSCLLPGHNSGFVQGCPDLLRFLVTPHPSANPPSYISEQPIKQEVDHEQDIVRLYLQIDDLRHCVDNAISSINAELKAMRTAVSPLVERYRQELYKANMEAAYKAQKESAAHRSWFEDGFWTEF